MTINSTMWIVNRMLITLVRVSATVLAWNEHEAIYPAGLDNASCFNDAVINGMLLETVKWSFNIQESQIKQAATIICATIAFAAQERRGGKGRGFTVNSLRPIKLAIHRLNWSTLESELWRRNAIPSQKYDNNNICHPGLSRQLHFATHGCVYCKWHFQSH